MILGFVLLLVLVVFFIAYPAYRYRKPVSHESIGVNQSAEAVENLRLFRKNEADLAAQLAGGQISASQHAELLVELQRTLIADQHSLRQKTSATAMGFGGVLVGGLALVVVVGSLFFYYKKGALADVAVHALQQSKMEQDYKDMLQNKAASPERAQELISAYQERTQAHPENIQYWFLLARAQMEVGQFGAAASAYQEVLKRDKQSAMVMAEAAQAIFLRDGNKTSEEVVSLARNALTLEPENTMAMGLLGIAAYNTKDFKSCIRYWQKAVDLLGENSQGAQALVAGIEKAKSAYVAAGGKLEDLTAKSIYSITLEVKLGPKAKVKPDQVVFVYARTFQGMPMPLAIQRLKVSDLPKTVQLDESMAMSPAASLATAEKVEVLARVSETGSAQAKMGDWLARQGPVDMKAIPEKIVLEINDQYQGN